MILILQKDQKQIHFGRIKCALLREKSISMRMEHQLQNVKQTDGTSHDLMKHAARTVLYEKYPYAIHV